jgi:FtsP/CotA-like multicopper oxidase with cupredoxin domain
MSAARARRIGRRRFLGAGVAGLGLGALAAGASGVWRGPALARQATPVPHDATPAGPGAPAPASTLYAEPPVRASRNGLLQTTFEVLPDISSGLGKMSYEGSIPGPTLRVQPGDRLRIRLINNLGGRDTNLHTHGMHVSPSGHSDNIFIHVGDNETFDYEYAIPADHPAGLYWYHPHAHGLSRDQVAGGLAGAIIVEGGLDDLPGFRAWTERLLILQGPFMGDQGPQYWVNGQMNPVIPIRPGETQRWRVLNASADAFYNLALDGHQLHWVASDGTPLPQLATRDHLLMGPGERAEVLIQGGPAGTYALRSAPWGAGGQAQPEFTLATMAVAGPEEEPARLPGALIAIPDLSDAAIARRRVVTFQEQPVDPVFNIDGLGFDPDRVDQRVELNTVEEWVVRNDSPDWHPFHIHVNDFQVMSVNGEPQPLRYDDTTAIPPHGEIVIRIPFLDFTGKFVYHCHILTHEDFGMMAVVEVVEPGGATSAGGITVVATGLASPRGMAWDDAGALYVAQSGTGATTTSVGPAASLVRIEGGCPVEVASGLPSSLDPFRDVMGPEDVAILAGQIYVLQGATGLLQEMNPATPNGIYTVNADGSLSLLADLTAWILANPTDLTPGDANDLGEPYRMQAGENGLWVLESNRGELLWVELDGQVTRVVDLSPDHPVWTALAIAPDGSLYAGTLTPSPHLEGSARVVRITPEGEVRDAWSGLSTVTGLAFGPDGSLYALEMATEITPDGGMPPGTGRVLRQTGPESHEVVLAGLEYPIALELGPDGALYVALPAYGANDQAGAIIRIDLDHPRPMVMDNTMLSGARCPEAAIYAPPQPDATPESLAGMHDHDATPVAVPGDQNAPGARTVTISDYAYDPSPLQVAAGTTVTWRNTDPVPHTATALDGSFDTGNIAPGESVSLDFTMAGSFAYTCLYHPNMAGTIEVQ